MEPDNIIVTTVFKKNKNFRLQREKRIEEAIYFTSGTIKSPEKHVVSLLPNGKRAYFHKPGKETTRRNPNKYDMSPNVGGEGIADTEGWTFDKMWEYLIKISIIHRATFKKILVLLYRNCFFLDHQENSDGVIRYFPSAEILNYINNIERFVLKDGFMEKFRTTEIGLLEYLHFIDLLGWNEDVKYHIVDNKLNFAPGKANIGRVNTMISVISAPLLISNFILDVVDKTANGGIIDVSLITNTIQKFSKSRGICVLSNLELLQQLSPYLCDQNGK